jgi:hypothetical protein
MTVWSLPAKLSANDDITAKKTNYDTYDAWDRLKKCHNFQWKTLLYRTNPSGILPEMVRDCQRCIQKKLHSKITRFPREGLCHWLTRSRTHTIVMLHNAHFHKRIWQKRCLWSCKLDHGFKHCPPYTFTDNTNLSTLWQDVFSINLINGQCSNTNRFFHTSSSSSFESLRVVSGFCTTPLFMTGRHSIVIPVTG